MAKTTKKPRNTKRNPNCAPLFNLTLPSGVRLGDATRADLEAAILPYAEESSNKGRLMREMIELSDRFERGQF